MFTILLGYIPNHTLLILPNLLIMVKSLDSMTGTGQCWTLLSGSYKRLSTNWITLRVHDVGKNLALIFLIVTNSILVSK